MKNMFIIIVFLLIIVSGCNRQNDVTTRDTNQPMKTSNTTKATPLHQHNIKQENAFHTRSLLLEEDVVKEVRAVEGKDLLLVAIELKHWNTFQSKSLTKKLKNKLKDEIGDKKIEATTDHKIFIELEKLEEKLSQNKLTEKELEKELKRLDRLMNEQT